MSDGGDINIDLSNLFAIANGDNMFVAALLGKMVKSLPESFARMETSVADKDWPELKAAAHKAKSTFAYLALEDMRNRLKDIEHNAMELENLDDVPEQVEEAVSNGNVVVGKLKEELAKLM